VSYYQVNLKAGQDYHLNVAGSVLLVDAVGVAGGIDITPVKNGSEKQTMPGRKIGFKYWIDFDGLKINAAVDTVAAVFVSFKDVNLGFSDGANVKVPDGVLVTNDATRRVPVDLGGAAINVTATNVGVNNTDANPVPVKLHASDDATPLPVLKQQQSTIVNYAPIAAGLAAAALVSDAALRRFTVRNNNAAAKIAIGGAGVTMANAAVILNPGDVWVEDDAPGAAWFVVSDTAGQFANVLGLKA
jgi:hypothetical protein